MNDQQLVLASTSPFRQQLLCRLDLPFVTANPLIDEHLLPDESPQSAALRLSEMKASAVSANYPDALIIGSDQIAYFGNEVFEKPLNHENAVKQLQKLSGKTVNFYTGLCVLNTRTGRARLQGVLTLVTFRDLSSHEIENYLHKEQPYNCAGSAKSEGLGIALIAKMEGDDPTALVGLPLIALCALLREENFHIL